MVSLPETLNVVVSLDETGIAGLMAKLKAAKIENADLASTNIHWVNLGESKDDTIRAIFAQNAEVRRSLTSSEEHAASLKKVIEQKDADLETLKASLKAYADLEVHNAKKMSKLRDSVQLHRERMCTNSEGHQAESESLRREIEALHDAFVVNTNCDHLRPWEVMGAGVHDSPLHLHCRRFETKEAAIACLRDFLKVGDDAKPSLHASELKSEREKSQRYQGYLYEIINALQVAGYRNVGFDRAPAKVRDILALLQSSSDKIKALEEEARRSKADKPKDFTVRRPTIIDGRSADLIIMDEAVPISSMTVMGTNPVLYTARLAPGQERILEAVLSREVCLAMMRQTDASPAEIAKTVREYDSRIHPE